MRLPLAPLALACAGCFIDIPQLEGGGGTSSSSGTQLGAGGQGGTGGDGGQDSGCPVDLACVELPADVVFVHIAEGESCSDARQIRRCEECACERRNDGGCILDIFVYEESSCARASRVSIGITNDCAALDPPIVALPGESIGVRASATAVGGLMCDVVKSVVNSSSQVLCEDQAPSPCGVRGACLDPREPRGCLLLADDAPCPTGFGRGELVADSEAAVQCNCSCAACLEAEFELYEEVDCSGPLEIHTPGDGDCSAHPMGQVGAMKDGTDSKPCTGIARPQQSRARLCCAE